MKGVNMKKDFIMPKLKFSEGRIQIREKQHGVFEIIEFVNEFYFIDWGIFFSTRENGERAIEEVLRNQNRKG